VDGKTFFGQLRRRNVYKVALAYAIVDPLRGDPRFERIVASLAPK
jgi:hypothetical protein